MGFSKILYFYAYIELCITSLRHGSNYYKCNNTDGIEQQQQ